MSSIQSGIDGQAALGFVGGMLTIDPANIWLASADSDPNAPAGYSVVNVNSFNGLSLISLQADNNITLNTLWTLTDPGVPSTLTLSAGNNITLNSGSGINAGNNWTVNLTAGTGFVPTMAQPTPLPGSDGIYMNGNSYVQTQNEDINLVGADVALVGVGNSGVIVNNVSTMNGGSIDVTAQYNIELQTAWTLADSTKPATLNLSAGNNIVLDNGTAIQAGQNWTVNLTAGTGLASGTLPAPDVRNDGIYLDGDAYIYTYGNINLLAANEVIVNGGDYGGVTTYGGGNIAVTAQYGNVNTGDNVYGYDFGQAAAPYYSVDYDLGGISTAAGGNVTIKAGGNVISFLPIQTGNPQDYLNAQYDGGSGAFGPQLGNVTINAGGNVYGHYVVANGVGTINAGGNVGAPLSVLANNPGDGFALSLIKGSWNVYAPNGSIYVQDVRNPNGIFGEYSGSSAANYPGYHYFDYDPLASLLLDAGDTVEFTGYEAPHNPLSSPLTSIPFLLPPILDVIAGSGGFILDTSVILFPSPDQNLNITTFDGGNFGIPNSVDPYTASPVTLEMSDSGASSWVDGNSFGTGDHANTLSKLDDSGLVNISISGNMNAVNLYTTTATHITVGGDMINSGFVGKNLNAGDLTSIDVAGQIYYSPIYTFVPLVSAIASANPLDPGAWDSLFSLALNPTVAGQVTSFNANNVGANGLAYYLKQNGYLLFPSVLSSSSTYGANPGFVYDPSSLQLGFAGSMAKQLSASQINALKGGTLTVLVADNEGNPIIDANGHLETMTYTFSAAPVIASLDTESLDSTKIAGNGLQIGGPGQLLVHAASIDLGYAFGIGSDGFGNAGLNANGFDYSSLNSLLPDAATGGASVTVTVDGDLNMISSAIYSRDGGDVNVTAGGGINLSQGTFVIPTDICYGIYTSGHSDVSVTASGTINIGSARIASFNGGNVFVESLNGDVNAGSGANIALQVYGYHPNPVTGSPVFLEFGDLTDIAALRLNPAPYGSGVLAEYPTAPYQSPGGKGQPGDITILTPHGNIVSTLGGISQFALDQSISGNPMVTLAAGTPGVAATADQGNILLGLGGVVGGTINITAQGNVDGLIVSRQNANIDATESFNGTVLSGGSANFFGAGTVSGTVVGIGGINVSGGATVTATLLSQNVSGVAGVAQSTLGTSASATSASQSAAGQSSNDTRQQVASNDTGDDDQKKKKKKPAIQHVGRVTVILSTAVPSR